MQNSIFLDTPAGMIKITETDGYITELIFKSSSIIGNVSNYTPLLREARKQIKEYFSGSRKSFDLPLMPSGTEFQKRAWRSLMDIPYGETRSYKQQAKVLGKPGSCRAVGAANGRNPILIVIPCHRLIGSDGRLTGYSGGLEVKEKLLKLEGAL